MIFNIATIFISLSLVLLIRQIDKKSKSMDRVRRYADKKIAEFESYFNQKKENLKDASLEMETHQAHALAVVKRLDSIIEEFNKKIEAQKILVETLDHLEEKSNHYDVLIKELFDMSERVEENLMKIKNESSYISKTERKIDDLKKQQTYLEKRIPQLEKEFTAENEASLDALTKGLLDKLNQEVHSIENSTNDALAKNEEILKKIEQSFEDAFATAIERADSVEGKAFDKLRNKAIERVEKTNAFLEEKTSFLNETIKSKIDETKKSISSFNDNWRNEANEYLVTMRLELKQVQDEYENTKQSIETRFSALNTETETKLFRFINEYQNMLESFEKDFSYKSESLEQGLAEIDILKQSLENSYKETSARVLDEFSLFTGNQSDALQKHDEAFENRMSKISGTIQSLENELQELKQRAYDNVSNQLTVFEDSFLTDLTKQSETLNENLVSWQSSFDAKLENLGLDYSDQRKALENKYTEELKEKIHGIQERFSAYTKTLENSFDEHNHKYQSEISSFDERLLLFVNEYKDAFEKTRQETDSYLKNEISHFRNNTEDQLKRYEKELAQSLDKMTNDINDSSQQAGALLDSIRNDFSDWKDRMNLQFVEAKTLFDDRYNSFNEDSQNVLKDLEILLAESVNKTSEESLVKFEKLEEKIQAISKETETTIQEYDQHSNDIIESFKESYKKMLDETEAKIQAQKAEVDEQLRLEKKLVQDIKLTNETSQDKMILKMQKDSDELNASLDIIDRKIKQFISQTQVFDKADELKSNLEGKIAELKNETAQLKQYETMIQGLEKQIEKLKKSEDEINQKVSKFNQEKKKIDAMEQNFNELVDLSNSIDKKVEGLKTTNDDLLILQGDVRQYQSTINEIGTKIDRLEKKDPLVQQTIEGVEKTFKMLEDLEKKLENCKLETADFPELIKTLQTDVNGLMKHEPQIREVLGKIDSLDEILGTTEERLDEMRDSKSWLASTESRLNEINKETKSYLKLLGEVQKKQSSRPASPSSKASVIQTRESVVQLAHLGWSPAQIAERLNLSLGEVELILNTSGE